jgi:NDP-sugar pyrophosphorylase family protein
MTQRSDLTAVILAGGLGTRLRPVVGDRQKVVAQVRGRPFLTYLFDQLAEYGFSRVVLCIGHEGAAVRTLLGDGYGGLRLVYSQEPRRLGTAGAIRFALPHLRSNTVLVMNGDSFCEADLTAFRDYHERAGAHATLLLTHVPDTGRYGRVTIDGHGRVTGFEEKGQAAGPGWINAGLYVLERAFVAAIPEPADREVSLERDVFPRAVGTAFYGFAGGGRFIDIGTPRSYGEAARFFSGEQPACNDDAS